MLSDADEEIDFITDSLQRLQQRRYQRMCRWLNNTEVTEDSQQSSKDCKGLLRRLQQELVALLTQDDVIFGQLLLLRRSISELKLEQQQLLRNQQLDEESSTSCCCSDNEDDLEVSYLSSSSCMTHAQHISNDGQSDYESFFASSRCTSCKHHTNNSEDSAISLESSNLSSLPASLAPSPTNVNSASVDEAEDDEEDVQPVQFHRHNVTFPPTRSNRKQPSNLLQSRTCSMSIPSGVERVGGGGDKACVQRQPQRRTVSPLVQMLVRSKSITFLPRGALIRREESCDSGFHASTPNSTTAREIFV